MWIKRYQCNSCKPHLLPLWGGGLYARERFLLDTISDMALLKQSIGTSIFCVLPDKSIVYILSLWCLSFHVNAKFPQMPFVNVLLLYLFCLKNMFLTLFWVDGFLAKSLKQVYDFVSFVKDLSLVFHGAMVYDTKTFLQKIAKKKGRAKQDLFRHNVL